jgi:hypothetical protein
MSRRALDRWHWACSVASPRLTGAQRAVLHVIAAHADADGRGAFVSQETMARSAGIGGERSTPQGEGYFDAAPVRKILKRLECMGLIEGERRSGKTTIWTLNPAWTPVHQDQGDGPAPRSSGTGETRHDPGPTPVLRDLRRRRRRRRSTPSLSSIRSEARGRGRARRVQPEQPRPVQAVGRMTRFPTCSTCGAGLLWANHRQVCPRPHCPGDHGEHADSRNLAASSSCAATGAKPAAAGGEAAGNRAQFLGTTEPITPILPGGEEFAGTPPALRRSRGGTPR